MSILQDLPCHLPEPLIGENVDPDSIAKTFEEKIGALEINDFAPEPIWRDLYAFTSSLRTFYGTTNIFSTWSKLSGKYKIHNVQLVPGSARIIRIGNVSTWIEAHYLFETVEPATTSRAVVSLVPSTNERWQIWVLKTILEGIKGYPSVDHLEPMTNHQANGITNGVSHENPHVDCVILGGGQAGLSLGGRLKALGLSYIILDKNKKIGDSWKLRYDHAKLHTTRDSSYLPFDKTFPSDRYGYFLTKDELAQGHLEWTSKFGISVWTESTLLSGDWHAEEKKWTLKIDHVGQAETITARYVVMATGAGGHIPKTPTYPGREDYRGDARHSSEFLNARAFKNKPAIVIGTANTGHDVAEDMVDAGCASVTMVQRSPTYVFDTMYYAKFLDSLYNDHIPIGLSDIAFVTSPAAVSRLTAMCMLHAHTRADPEPYDGLERAGFKLIRYGDVVYQLLEKFGGHYMDQGAVAKINNGSIKVKSDALPVRYTERGLLFSDGKELDADLIVFATGFEGNTKTLVRQILGSETADQIDEFWGVDAEGETRGNYRPCGHPGLWMIGGGIPQARYLTRFVALSIKAAVDGTPLNVYQG